MDVFDLKTYTDTASLITELSLIDPNNPWDPKKYPKDYEEIILLLGTFLQSAVGILKKGNAYRRFDIPKWRGKFRHIEAPDGKDATIHCTSLQRKVQLAADTLLYWRQNSEHLDQATKIRHALTHDLGSSGITSEDTINVLRASQKAISGTLSKALPLSESVCGFRYRSGAYKGLRQLLRRFYLGNATKIQSVYQLDIKNFFPSISEKMAADGILNSLKKALHWDKDADEASLEKSAALLARIACIDGRLSQWGHLSPLLANHAASHLIDPQIEEVIRRYRRSTGYVATYGRYADDIIILSSGPMEEEWRHEIDTIVSKHFVIAEEKRLYEEGKGRYNIWWASLLSERIYPKTVSRKDGGAHYGAGSVDEALSDFDFRFKLPKNSERRIVEKGLECTRLLHESIAKKQSFAEESKLMQMFYEVVGDFSHAYHVSKFGWVFAKGSDGIVYELPKELLFVWEKFRAAAKEKFSENPSLFRWTFSVADREDEKIFDHSFEQAKKDIEEWKKESLASKQTTIQTPFPQTSTVPTDFDPTAIAEFVREYNEYEEWEADDIKF